MMRFFAPERDEMLPRSSPTWKSLEGIYHSYNGLKKLGQKIPGCPLLYDLEVSWSVTCHVSFKIWKFER